MCGLPHLHVPDNVFEHHDGVIHNLNGVGSGLSLDSEDDGAIILKPRGSLVVLNTVSDFSELIKANRRAVSIGNDKRTKLLSCRQLAIGLNCVGVVLAEECAG